MIRMCNKVLLIIGAILYSALVYPQNSKEDPNLQAAFQAHGALKLKEAKALFQKVTKNENTTEKDRCDALRELATIEWKHYKNYDSAKSHLKLADSIGDYRSETWLKLLRVEAESQNYFKALEAGEKAILLSESEADKTYSKYRYCKVLLDQTIAQLDNNKPINSKLLSKAALLLQEVLYTNPTNVNAADILLGISLLQKDGITAMKAWLAYYRFANVESTYDYLKPTTKHLEQILQQWNSRALNNTERIELVKVLGQSRFYRYAKILAKRFNLKSSETFVYANYAEAIKAITDEYYRLVSIGKPNSDDFLNTVRTKNEALYKQLADDKAEDYSPNNFRDLIRSKFGSVFLISSSSASRQVGLVFGHIVNERIRTIEQYGHSADFTFTELDMMVSNGYPSWFWENRGAGGYALTGGFLRIKTMFKFLAINAWEKVTDTVKRAKIEKSIKANLLSSTLDTDIKIIRSALAKKVELDALDKLYNELKNKGLKGLGLQLKFIEQYELYRDNATMFAHEGRHSIDRVVLGGEYRALGSKVIEYRGRLSQIAFSKAPKLELANMLSGISSTPTGQSNKMILDVLENWIKANTHKIKNYDADKKAISQLYKLTDAQIIDCIKQADPFYLDYIKNN